MDESPLPILAAPLPPPPARVAYLLRLDPETAAALHELGGLRSEKPGTVARKLLTVLIPQELEALKRQRETA